MATIEQTGRARDGAGEATRRSWRWVLVPLGVFLASRLADALMIALASRDQLAMPADSTGYHVHEARPASPGYLGAVTNWDGQWFQSIAEDGYPDGLPRASDGEVENSSWAFAPGYPAVVRLVMAAGSLPFAVAATLVSVTCGAVAVCVLFRMLERTSSRFSATATVTALCCFPTAPVLQVAYAESLALMLLVLALDRLQRERYATVALLGVLLAFTRPIVLPLAAVIALHGLLRWVRRGESPFSSRDRIGCVAAAVTTGLSFFAWPLVVGLATGVPDAFVLTHQAWILDEGEAGWPSWLAHVLGGGPRAPAVLAVVVVAASALLVLRRAGRAWGFELRAWALVYALYLVSATRPTTSSLRHAMLALVPWWPTPMTDHDEDVTPAAKVTVLAGMVAVGLLAQWFWISWFFVPSAGGGLGFP